MDFKFFVRGITNMLINPVKAWETIDSENKPVKVIRNSFLLPLIILVSVSTIAGSMLFNETEMSAAYSIIIGIRTFISLYLTIYLSSLLLGEITFPLDLGRDYSVSFRIISFSMAPLLLCQILSGIFDSLLFVNVLGLYGFYIFWTGSGQLLNPPGYKKMPLLIASAISIGVIYVVTNFLLVKLIDKIYYSFIA